MPSFRLDGRRALVTGAGRGIGAAASAALAEFGADVVLVARSAPEVESVAQAIRKNGGKADALPFDISRCSDFREVVLGGAAYDILVNNAGVNRPRPLSAIDLEDFDAVFGLNVRASFFVTQAIVEGLVLQGRSGSIINISSQMGHVGAANRSLYCASKHALEGLTKALAIELAPLRIRVNSIAPTFIETSMTRPFLEDPSFRREVMDKIKLGRLGKVDDIMGAVVYLASEASALVTGTSMVVDGGWTAE